MTTIKSTPIPTNFLDEYYIKVPARQRQWHIDNCVTSIPLCQTCGVQKVNWSIKNKSYSRFCSSKCAHNHPDVRSKTEATCLEKYGETSNLKTAENKEKQKETCISRYGVSNFSKTSQFKEKFKETCLERYGVTNPSKLPEVQERIDQTHLEKYGRKRSSQAHITEDVVSMKNNQALMKEWFFDLKMPVSAIAERLGINHSQLCVHFKENLNIDISRHTVSYPEQQLFTFVKSLCNDAIASDRTLIKPKELDIVVPSKKLAIEYHGLAWHCEINGRKSRTYHLDKLDQTNSAGYDLIQIFSNEWGQNPELVKSRIRSKLGMTNTLYARKCRIVSPNATTVNQFLNASHIQGSCPYSVAYGLEYNGQLVAVMTLGKPRFNKKNQWELIRLASTLNTNITGGPSKLLSHFIRTHNPTSIISYCDRRWNTGTVYKKLGFTHERTTGPNYWYVSSYRYVHNRMQFQKHKLTKLLESYDSTLTEWENMSNNGYDRVWDCGNTVWVWNQ